VGRLSNASSLLIETLTTSILFEASSPGEFSEEDNFDLTLNVDNHNVTFHTFKSAKGTVGIDLTDQLQFFADICDVQPVLEVVTPPSDFALDDALAQAPRHRLFLPLAPPVQAKTYHFISNMRRSSSAATSFPETSSIGKIHTLPNPKLGGSLHPSISFNGLCNAPVVPTLPSDLRSCEVPLNCFEEIETSAR